MGWDATVLGLRALPGQKGLKCLLLNVLKVWLRNEQEGFFCLLRKYVFFFYCCFLFFFFCSWKVFFSQFIMKLSYHRDTRGKMSLSELNLHFIVTFIFLWGYKKWQWSLFSQLFPLTVLKICSKYLKTHQKYLAGKSSGLVLSLKQVFFPWTDALGKKIKQTQT